MLLWLLSLALGGALDDAVHDHHRVPDGRHLVEDLGRSLGKGPVDPREHIQRVLVVLHELLPHGERGLRRLEPQPRHGPLHHQLQQPARVGLPEASLGAVHAVPALDPAVVRELRLEGIPAKAPQQLLQDRLCLLRVVVGAPLEGRGLESRVLHGAADQGPLPLRLLRRAAEDRPELPRSRLEAEGPAGVVEPLRLGHEHLGRDEVAPSGGRSGESGGEQQQHGVDANRDSSAICKAPASPGSAR